MLSASGYVSRKCWAELVGRPERLFSGLLWSFRVLIAEGMIPGASGFFFVRKRWVHGGWEAGAFTLRPPLLPEENHR